MAGGDWKRVGWLVVIYLLILEATSWLFRTMPGCLVNPQNYGAYYAEHQECPTFHVFLIKLFARIFEIFGRPEWVVAIFTAVLAFATYFLWRATVRLVRGAEKTAERQLRAYVLGNGGSIRIFQANDGNRGLEAHYELKNFGQTPATRFRSWIAMDVLDIAANPFDKRSVGFGSEILAPTDVRHLPVRFGPILLKKSQVEPHRKTVEMAATSSTG